MQDFFDWLSEIERNAPTTPIGEIMTACGFKVQHTGGGCLAWHRDLPNGEFVWICDEGNGLGDTFTEDYIAGHYGPNAEEHGYADTPKFFDNLNWALCREYEAWNKAQGLNLGSADEHLFDEKLSDEQRAWVNDFHKRWEVMTAAETRNR